MCLSYNAPRMISTRGLSLLLKSDLAPKHMDIPFFSVMLRILAASVDPISITPAVQFIRRNGIISCVIPNACWYLKKVVRTINFKLMTVVNLSNYLLDLALVLSWCVCNDYHLHQYWVSGTVYYRIQFLTLSVHSCRRKCDLIASMLMNVLS